MKKIFILVLVVFIVSGCVSISIPQYISKQSEYKQKFYADFEEVFNAALAALHDLKWEVAGTANPMMYEETVSYDPNSQQMLIFTETKQSLMLLFSRYNRLNILARSMADSVEIEVRFEAMTAYPFHTAHNYKNDRLAEKIFNRISGHLNQ